MQSDQERQPDQERHRGRPSVWDAGPLHRPLARAVWSSDPVVRLHYNSEDDALVAEILDGPVHRTTKVHDLLVVEFDGLDASALPTTLCLARAAAEPSSAAAEVARAVLGDRVWTEAQSLACKGSGRAEVRLTSDEQDARLSAWRGLVQRLRQADPAVAARQDRRPFAFGFDLQPATLRGVLVNADGNIIDFAEAPLPGTTPSAVAAAVAAMTEALSRRHAGVLAGRPVVAGLQLAGPVDSAAGTVHYYYKPVGPGVAVDPWRSELFAERLRAATGLRAFVFNDTEALATHETRFGFGARPALYAVLLISQGIGAKLVKDGAVLAMPMEIGRFVSNPWRHPDHGHSIEAAAGIPAILHEVAHVADRPIDSVEVAAALAESEDDSCADKVRRVFQDAGEAVAVGIGAVQTIANPRAWAVFGPAAIVHERYAAARAFRRGLGHADRHVDYDAVRGPIIEGRVILPTTGPRAAALTALERCVGADDHIAPVEA